MILLQFKEKKIKGTSTTEKHEEWIMLESLQLGVGRAIITSDGGNDRKASAPSFSEVSLSRATDAVSPDLFMQAASGISLGDAEIHFLNTGGEGRAGQVFLEIVLSDAIISSYSISANGGVPGENIAINFTKISFKYNSFDGKKIDTGTPKVWDLKKNKQD